LISTYITTLSKIQISKFRHSYCKTPICQITSIKMNTMV